MTAPKKRALVEALEALIPLAEGRSNTLAEYAARVCSGEASVDLCRALRAINTARALVEAYRKEKGDG